MKVGNKESVEPQNPITGNQKVFLIALKNMKITLIKNWKRYFWVPTYV